MLERIFKLKENRTNVKTELVAGLTTFMTMAYILAVNPQILSASGMDPTAVLIATCLASFIGTVCMAFMANLPFALSAGMGLNAYLAYTVCGSMGYPWQVALLAVFVEGLIFIILSLTNVREAIFNAIPAYLCIIAMPLFYSIAEGICIGIIAYVVMNLFCKKWKEISPSCTFSQCSLFLSTYSFNLDCSINKHEKIFCE